MKKRGETQGQLKMFMTPSEIHEGWQPLDADRHEYGRETYVPRGSDRSTFQGGSGYRRSTGGSYVGYTHHGSKYKTVEESESDEALYSRKLDEAQGYGDEDSYEPKMVGSASRWTYPMHHHGGKTATEDLSSTARKERAWAPRTTGGGAGSYETEGTEQYVPGNQMTLHESIGESGVQSPIRLGSEIGSMGKPQIVGGHHRLASATEHSRWGGKGEQFVPVLHYKNIGQAKTDPVYKYT